jgi:hypothetical protein
MASSQYKPLGAHFVPELFGEQVACRKNKTANTETWLDGGSRDGIWTFHVSTVHHGVLENTV